MEAKGSSEEGEGRGDGGEGRGDEGGETEGSGELDDMREEGERRGEGRARRKWDVLLPVRELQR
jgi:hypothetical protein